MTKYLLVLTAYKNVMDASNSIDFDKQLPYTNLRYLIGSLTLAYILIYQRKVLNIK